MIDNDDIYLLELYSGSRSVGKVAEEMGIKVFSVDNKDFPGTSLVKDIEFLTIDDIPFIPNIIWASIPCTSYSLAAISTHRNGIIPRTEFGKKSDRLAKNTLKLMSAYPDALWYIENPRAMLRKMPFMQGLPRTTVTYCQYGDTRMKPTDIWSNNIYSIFNQDGWRSRPMCKNGDTCHVSAPRGSRTGTQGLGNAYLRSIIPEELCREILVASKRKLL